MNSTPNSFRQGDHFIKTRAVLDELRAEFDAASIALDTDERLTVLRRGAIRAGLAYLDAALDHLKFEARRCIDDQTYEEELTEAEFEALDSEKNPWDPATLNQFSLEFDLVLLFQLAAKIWHLNPSEFSPTPENKEALRRTIIRRELLMYPRSVSELEIDDVDLRTCNVAVAWVSAKLHRVISAASTEGTQRRHPDVAGLDCTYIWKMAHGFNNAKERRE